MTATIPCAASRTWRRFVDTRLIGLAFEPDETRQLHFAGWLPDDATTVHLALTVHATSPGRLTVWPDGDPRAMRTIVFVADRTQRAR